MTTPPTDRPPTLLLVKTFVLHCYACKRFVGRVPQWDDGELGKGWQCEACGNTSTMMKEGRPFGPRYRHWNVLVDEFNGFAKVGMLEGLSGKFILETVKLKVHCDHCNDTGDDPQGGDCSECQWTNWGD